MWAGLWHASATIAACLGLASGGSVRAGDLLRGGAAYGTQNTGGANGITPQVAQARANAADLLARTTEAVQAVQMMQNAAHAAATATNLGLDPNHPGLQLPSVPDGLATGGLQVAAGATSNSSLWQGASLPFQYQSGGQTVVDVQQNSATAVLNWQTFNVGRNTLLNFDQSAGGSQVNQWVVFNKVSDPSGVPSQILGSIQAQGQVYVVNSNGIIFGGSSQVNTHALVASSLPINDNLISAGLLNNPDDQFLFSSLAILPHAQRVLARLQSRYDIFIASAAMEVPSSFAAKYDWLADNFPFIPTSHIVFCGDKSILRADYLIDDNPRQLALFENKQHGESEAVSHNGATREGILYTSPANVDITGYRRVNDWLAVEKMFLP